jgi:hypothetical protein
MPRKRKVGTSRTRQYNIAVHAEMRPVVNIHHLIAALRTIVRAEKIDAKSKKSKV